MNDIGRLAHVEQAVSPLHVRAYFDQALYAREQELIFKQCATYLGHEKACPNRATGAACPTRKAAACWCAMRAAWSWCPTSAATARR